MHHHSWFCQRDIDEQLFAFGINSALNPIIDIPDVVESSGIASISTIRPETAGRYKCDDHLSLKLWFIGRA
jgi:hypothetical protein